MAYTINISYIYNTKIKDCIAAGEWVMSHIGMRPGAHMQESTAQKSVNRTLFGSSPPNV